jgi:general secretion pathway protein F
MPNFLYKAKTAGGEIVTGTLAAGDKRLAIAELGRKGFFPISLDASDSAGARTVKPVKQTFRGRISTRDTLAFTQQLSTLLRSGMSLSQALSTLERRLQKPRMRALVGQVRSDIVQGIGLSEAMAKYPKVFSKLYVNLIRAGEASGTLDQVLVRLVHHYEQAAEVRERVVSAMIYPLIVVSVGIGTIIFFMTFMVPKFAIMFKEMRATMPLPTRMLIAFSDAVANFWWIPVGLLVIAVILYKQQARTDKGRLRIDALKLRLPVFGKVILAGALAQFARTLATLLENGVPVLTALQIVEATMTNQVIANELQAARQRVTDGTSLSQPLSSGKIFPPLLIDMLAVGEESGEVVPALKNIAETYESELSRTLKTLTTLLEPAIILMMAVVVGGIVLSVLLAVFDITSGIGR